MLPFCQRCTGLYVGGWLAALLHFWLRPRLTGRFLAAHGAFLLFMAPFGFHWVAHGPEVRTITGTLFGFGVVTFLWLPVQAWIGEMGRESLEPARPRAARLYSAGMVMAAAGLPLLAAWGGRWAGGLLSLLAALGAVVFAFLVLANLGLVMRFACRTLRGRLNRQVS